MLSRERTEYTVQEQTPYRTAIEDWQDGAAQARATVSEHDRDAAGAAPPAACAIAIAHAAGPDGSSALEPAIG